MSRILAFSCTHAPYHHPDALDFLATVKRKYKPDTVVCLGDLGDGHGWSRHTRLPDSLGQGDEDAACIKFCKRLYTLFPKAKACVGNHCLRLVKAAQRAGIPSRMHADIQKMYESPDGWEWADYHKNIDGLAYFHGDQVRGAEPALQAVRHAGMSCVIGHHHSHGCVKQIPSEFGIRYAVSVGCLVDGDSYGLAYAQRYIVSPALGCAVVLDGIPQFVPMV